MKVWLDFLLWLFAIGCFFGCWAFDDWCDTKVEIEEKQLMIEQQRTQQVLYETLRGLK